MILKTAGGREKKKTFFCLRSGIKRDASVTITDDISNQCCRIIERYLSEQKRFAASRRTYKLTDVTEKSSLREKCYYGFSY